jgi:hypothetical protein
VHKLQPKIIISVLLTLVVYMSSILFFRNYFDTSAINEQFLMKVMIITAICWLPIHLIKRIGDRISPSEEDKLPKNDKNKNNKGLLPDS